MILPPDFTWHAGQQFTKTPGGLFVPASCSSPPEPFAFTTSAAAKPISVEQLEAITKTISAKPADVIVGPKGTVYAKVEPLGFSKYVDQFLGGLASSLGIPKHLMHEPPPKATPPSDVAWLFEAVSELTEPRKRPAEWLRSLPTRPLPRSLRQRFAIVPFSAERIREITGGAAL